MRRTVAAVKAPQRRSTDEEIDAARDRLLEALHPRTGPPTRTFVHIPGLPNPEPHPALTIREAMGVPIARPTGSR